MALEQGFCGLGGIEPPTSALSVLNGRSSASSDGASVQVKALSAHRRPAPIGGARGMETPGAKISVAV
jgi:hypothetical protein